MLSPSRLNNKGDSARRKLTLSLMKKRIDNSHSELDSNNRHCYDFTIGFHGMFEDNSLNKESRRRRVKNLLATRHNLF